MKSDLWFNVKDFGNYFKISRPLEIEKSIKEIPKEWFKLEINSDECIEEEDRWSTTSIYRTEYGFFLTNCHMYHDSNITEEIHLSEYKKEDEFCLISNEVIYYLDKQDDNNKYWAVSRLGHLIFATNPPGNNTLIKIWNNDKRYLIQQSNEFLKLYLSLYP